MRTETIAIFKDKFGAPPTVIAQAPGRLEILGNHTDYNDGVVLSTAVDRFTCFACAPVAAPAGDCRVYCSILEEERTFKLERLQDKQPGDWANYIKGVIVALNRRGVQVPAFNAVIRSNVPLSAGMSSSAALEMAAAKALCQLYRTELPWLDMARAGQEAENQYVGAQTGLLDQFSSLRGQAGCFVFSDFRDLSTATVKVPAGTALVVANSMVKHVLTNEYNERRQACEAAVEILRESHPAITALRDVTTEQVMQAKAALGSVNWRRALHVTGENERVMQGIRALEANDVAGFGRLMCESHESSRLNFENSCTELDVLVELGQSLPGALGARLSGGGFGGISVHLVHASAAAEYAARLTTAYRTRTGIETQAVICQAADGAAVSELD